MKYDHQRENAWHAHLNCRFSLDFWKNTWQMITSIKFENKIKWLQYQIARKSLKVKHIVNKFRPDVSSLCTYCNEEAETISHLFWSCEKVHRFWDSLTDFFRDNNMPVPLERNKILFGIHNEPYDSTGNFIILCAKLYIWRNKFADPHSPLSLAAFINMIKLKVTDHKNICEMLKKFEKAQEWDTLLTIL